jgi:hypothetical protein
LVTLISRSIRKTEIFASFAFFTELIVESAPDGSVDCLALTQAQIKQIVKHHGDWLKKGGNGTFSLFKVGNEFFVAAAYFFSDGRLGKRVRGLTLERVFRAQKRHRLVVKSS